MRRFLSAAILAAPLAVLAQPASAQYFSGYSTNIGNTTFGNYNTPYGQINTNTTRIGNTIFSNASDRYGSTNCTTQVIGNSVFTNCN